MATGIQFKIHLKDLGILSADFVDGLQKVMFPYPPAIHATWLWLLP
jgi:hypothetical protein